MDTVFRKPTPTVEAPQIVGSSDTSAPSVVNPEPPYLDYENLNAKPLSVDYFKLGDTWKEPTGGFPDEISTIEEYFKDQVVSGEIANSISAVKTRLKEIEKVTGTSKEERNVLKIGIISNYIKFLRSNSDLKHNIKRYGSSI